MSQLVVTPQMQTLHELLRNGVEYEVPVFQRNYNLGTGGVERFVGRHLRP